MDSFKFFEDKQFNGKWKGKSGIYIIENPLFTSHTKFPVYKVGYARNSMYTRISNYRTAYGLVPFKIHCMYEIHNKVIGERVNYAHLTERVLQETARKYGQYAGIGEWFKNLPILLNILKTIREDHLNRNLNKASTWEFYTFEDIKNSINPIQLVDEKDITGMFKDLTAGRHTRSGDNELDTLDAEEYEMVALSGKNEIIKQTTPVQRPRVRIQPKRTVNAVKKQKKLLNSHNEYLIHDGTRARDYLKRRFRIYFPAGKDDNGNSYKAGYYEGRIIGFKVYPKRKVPIAFDVKFDDDESELEKPIPSTQMLKLLI